MKEVLITRLINAACACDAKGDHNLAALIHEAIEEIEHPDRCTGDANCPLQTTGD